jgi:hypothetical protein
MTMTAIDAHQAGSGRDIASTRTAAWIMASSGTVGSTPSPPGNMPMTSA